MELWADKSPLSEKLGLVIPVKAMPVSVCTSSGAVGYSPFLLGRADAATIVAKDAALADAEATALDNRVGNKGELAAALERV